MAAGLRAYKLICSFPRFRGDKGEVLTAVGGPAAVLAGHLGRTAEAEAARRDTGPDE